MKNCVFENHYQQIDYLRNCITTVPDYPAPGILFRDITSLLQNPQAYSLSIQLLTEQYASTPLDKIVGTEARGFLFGAPVALALGVGFVPVRKPGKLPRAIFSESYQLEYGEDRLEIHQDAIRPGEKVLIIDDLLATGGTAEATVNLVRRSGGLVSEAAFVINLFDLGGAQSLEQLDVHCWSLLDFPGH